MSVGDAVRMSTRKRCSECRKTFTPSPRARSRQRVCGAECRARRDRTLARQRRRAELHAYRADERERQKTHRASPLEAACNAPASASNPLKLQKKIGRIVARTLALSRASLMRDLPRIYGEFEPKSGNDVAAVTR